MADTSKYIQAQKFTIAVGISTTDTSIVLQNFNFPDGTAIASGDLGAINYGTLEPGSSREEQISFTGITTNGDGTVTLTGVTRGLGFGAVDTYSEQADLKVQHGAGAVFIMSNTAAFYDTFVNKNNDESMAGMLTVQTPTASGHAATKQYVDDNVNGGAVSQDRVVMAGNAGESVSAGDLVYFDDTDNEWKKTDATTATTVDNALLGIAQGSGSDGGAISGGVLTYGLDSNQTGLTVGVKLYASDTAGAIAESAGTTEKIIGWSKSATEVYFDPFHGELPTANEKDAMAGTSGTPSSTNPYRTKFEAQGSLKSMTAGATISGATLPVPVYQNDSDNEFYACDGNDTSAMKFLGFAVSNGTDGSSIDVQFSGVVSGFTGLSEGEKYYLQDAVGTIGTTIGTYEVLVGVAISETELLIQKGRRQSAGTVDLSAVEATGTEVITCGFRPTKIRINGMAQTANGTSFSHMAMVWTNGAYSTVQAEQSGDPSGFSVGTSGILYYGGTSAYLTFTITSVTDTGFTITYTETGSITAKPSGIVWEAEGEL